MKWLILSSSTGGGHNMRAKSLRDWARRCAERREIEVTLHQALEATHPVYGLGVGIYNTIQRVWPRLHHGYFHFLEIAGLHRDGGKIMGTARFVAILADLKPDVIISTHGHLNHGFFDIARQVCGESVRCVTYCGELSGGYGFSRHWVNPGADLFIGAVEETCAAARELGMPEEKIMLGGFMLQPRFFSPPAGKAHRRDYLGSKLGLHEDRFTLLLSTGANGAVNHPAFIRALDNAGLYLQVIALCGRNDALRARLEAERPADSPIRVKALGYCDEMEMLMDAVDAIVARPGTGTTSEAMLRGCPILFNTVGGAMPQECITLAFAKKHGFGRMVPSASALPTALSPWIRSEKARQAEQERMTAALPQGHPSTIIARLQSLAGGC
jgi:processive 1,2-diacylglycerol beta-glucosyltransferase